MFNIVLYKFNKRPNSTALPSQTTVSRTFSCAMKTITSVITPMVEISDTRGNNDIPLFNYAYISDFQRYYFIEDIRFDLGVWTLYLRCDVLATYEEDIFNSRQYILRSESNFNPDLIDTLYNTYVDSTSNYSKVVPSGDPEVYNSSSETWVSTSAYFDRSISSGAFCIGVVGNNLTGVSYYIMPANTFKALLNDAFNVVPSTITDVSSGIAQAIFNPLQYVTYCRWFPTLPLSGNLGPMVRYINFGGQRVPETGYIGGSVDTFCYQVDANQLEEYRIVMNLPKHPQAQSYPYLSLSPFSEYSLYFQPFGVIPLDSTKIYAAAQIRVEWKVDYCTGACELQVYSISRDLDDDPLVYSESTQIGVNIPISSLVMDWKVGLGLSALQWVRTKAEGMSGGAPLTSFGNANRNMNDVRASIESSTPSDNTDLLSTIMDTLGASLGQVSTKGSSGSFIAYNLGKPYIFAFFMNQTTHFPERFGQPCCKTLRLDNLTGFVICSNASVSFAIKNPTVDEQNAICSMLNTGVYLE